MSILRRASIILGVTIVAASVWFSVAWYNFLYSPCVAESQGIQFKVPLGASYKTVSNDLYQLKIISHPVFFNFLFQLRHEVHHLRAGEYLFPHGATASTILQQIVTGKGLVYHDFIIIPGMTFKQIRHSLNQLAELQHTTLNLSDAEIMKQLGSAGLYPEGQFYPDTYFYVADSTDVSLLKRAFHTMTKKFMKAWETRAPDNYFKTPYEALIAASIIEKEAKVREELPIIAGVMINRLKKDMLLQFDPTVIYGIGDRYDGKIYKWDLTDENPYNTYLHKGLPPTPIAMPGKEAIAAVMHPQQNDYYYFVAHSNHLTHQFSRTLDEHVTAVNAGKIEGSGFVNYTLLQKYVLKSWQQNAIQHFPANTLRVQ